MTQPEAVSSEGIIDSNEAKTRMEQIFESQQISCIRKTV
jgi:hypothetical protein